MEENELQTPQEGQTPQQGRRLDPGASGTGRGKIALIVVGAILAVLAAAYLILCAVAANSGFLPGTRVAGVDVSGMDAQGALNAVSAAAQERYQGLEVPISVGDKTVRLSAKDAGVTVDAEAAGRELDALGHPSFLAAGGKYLAGLFGAQTDAHCPMKVENENYVNQILDEAAHLAGGEVAEAEWTVEEDEESARLTLTKGRTGQSIDREALLAQVRAALEEGSSAPIAAQVTVTPPQAPDFEKMAADVAREPMDATLDVETDEVIPHRLGLALDPGKAKAVYDALDEGEQGKVELSVTQPEVTTLDLRATLFRDILGEGSSKISGDANRTNNVRLAAAACDGVILLPGQQMSYNQTTGQRTSAKGYREATGYTAKGQEMMVGGGVCQPSSTLYMACLNAELEIVNRKNHMYTVSYMPEGVDATVSWPNLDYVFANNTKYPIKVSMTIENKVLTARIYGTKTNDTHVKLESVRLSTTPAGVTYQADPEIPQGTTKVVQGAHTGKKVEVYKNVYDSKGNLLSRTWISTDTYRPSDKIIAYNPLDGVPGVIDPLPPTDPSLDPTQDPAVDPSAGTGDQPQPTTDPGTTTPDVPSPPPVEPPAVTTEPTPAPTVEPTQPPVDISLLPPEGIPTD